MSAARIAPFNARSEAVIVGLKSRELRVLSVTSVMGLVGFSMVRPISSGGVLHPFVRLDVVKHLNVAGKFIRFCVFELSRVVPRIELKIEAGRDAAYTAALNVLDAAPIGLDVNFFAAFRCLSTSK